MKTIVSICWRILNVLRLGGALQLLWKGKYLSQKGWLESYYRKESIDRDGNPLPWCTYPFIQFIESRLNSTMNIFEYGCGNSTLWYAQKVNNVTSVEHDLTWASKISSRLPGNATVQYSSLSEIGKYSTSILLSDKRYHIIVIDGRDRNNCVIQSLKCLTEDGIIVFDNSQLPEYADSMALFIESGFRRIDFYGMLPIVPHENCTSIFYRTKNCLNI
jgi:hypothetical protein